MGVTRVTWWSHGGHTGGHIGVTLGSHIWWGHVAAHLLDRRASLVGESERVLAALARVGLAAQLVHRLGERLVALNRDGAERHGARAEALDDRRDGLHLPCWGEGGGPYLREGPQLPYE
eukprot:1124068-Prymnesium_polylepis.1